MEIRENPYVTQLAIARPNPFDPRKQNKTKKSQTSKTKERSNMLLGARSNPSSQSSHGYRESSEDVARRENIMRALNQLSSEGDSRDNPKTSRAKKASTAKRSVAKKTTAVAKKSATKKGRKNPISSMNVGAVENPVGRRTGVASGGTASTSKATTGRGVRAKKKAATSAQLMGTVKLDAKSGPQVSVATGKFDTKKIQEIADQVRKLRKEYTLSQSPSLKKRLDRAVAKLEKMSEYVNKDLRRLEQAANLLSAENPKKGGTMKKTASSKAKKAPARKKSSAIFKDLLSSVKSTRSGKKAASKSAAKKTSRSRRNPLESLEGLDEEAIENPKTKRKTASKKKVSSAKKKVTRRAGARKSTRRNPIELLGDGILENPKTKRKTASKKKVSSAKKKVTRRAGARKSTRRNPIELLGDGILENPKTKRKAASKKRVSSAKKKVTRRTGARKTTRRNPIELLGDGILENPKTKRKAASTKKRATSTKKRVTRRAGARKTTRRNPIQLLGNGILENPKTKRRTSSVKKRATSSASKVTRRSTSGKRAGGLSRSVVEALRHFDSNYVTIHRGGKNTKISAQKNSAEYKTAKAKGLTGRFAALSGKKNTPYSLNIRSIHALVSGTPSVADIQKALNAWAGAFDGGHIKTAKANPKKRVARKATSRKATVKRTSRKRSATKKRSTRRNPIELLGDGILENPKTKRKSTSKKRKTSATKKRRTTARKLSTAKKRVTSAKKKTTAKKGHGRKIAMRKTHAILRHNPAMGTYITNPFQDSALEPVGMGTKIGFGALGFATSFLTANIAAGLVENAVDSKGSTTADLATHAALAVGAGLMYHHSAKSEQSNSLFVGIASGLIGSAIARNVGGVEKMIAKIPGIGSAMKWLSGGSAFAATSGYGEFNPDPVHFGEFNPEPIHYAGFQPAGLFISESPLITMEGYMTDDYVENPYEGMGKYANMKLMNKITAAQRTRNLATSGFGKFVPMAEMDAVVASEKEYLPTQGFGKFIPINEMDAAVASEKEYLSAEGFEDSDSYVATSGDPSDYSSDSDFDSSEEFSFGDEMSAGTYFETPVSGVYDQIKLNGVYDQIKLNGVYDQIKLNGVYDTIHPLQGIVAQENRSVDGYLNGSDYEEFNFDIKSLKNKKSRTEGSQMANYSGLLQGLAGGDMTAIEQIADIATRAVQAQRSQAPQQAQSQQAPMVLNQSEASQLAPARVGGAGVDVRAIMQELRDVDALNREEMKAEGLPDIENVDVAVIRATPYYARQIAESNLGYILKDSDVVKGSYIVGLYVGPGSMLANTGMGVRDLSIPHGVRNARPAGIFTNTIFSAIIPNADGGPIWAGGDDGDL